MLTIERNKEVRGYSLSTEQRLPAPLEEVFDFFADAFNLEEITPPWLNFSVLTDAPIEMRPGTLIDYKLRLHGLPIKWKTEITAWEPPFHFVDEQLSGPYKLWHHEHFFRADGDETIVTDRVDYRVPGGALAHWLLVRRDLEKIFGYRHQQLERIFANWSARMQTSVDE